MGSELNVLPFRTQNMPRHQGDLPGQEENPPLREEGTVLSTVSREVAFRI